MKHIHTFGEFVNENLNEEAKVYIDKGNKLTQLEIHDSYNGKAVVIRYYNGGFGANTTLIIGKDKIDEFCEVLQKMK